MQLHTSIIEDDILMDFKELYGERLFRTALDECSIEYILAIANLLCPKFVEIDGHVILYEYIANNENKESLVRGVIERYGNDRKKVEMFFNTQPAYYFFMIQSMPENEALMLKYFEVLKYFWRQRLAIVFPQRSFNFEIGEGLFPEELAFSFTFYQI